MKRWNLSCIPLAPGAPHIVSVLAVAVTLCVSIPARAQTRSVRDTATTYGARLNAKGEPADLNPNRINNRVNSRLDTRLSLRIERYRPNSTGNPAAAFEMRAGDNGRTGTNKTISPLFTSTSTSQAYEETPAQPPSPGTDAPSRPH